MQLPGQLCGPLEDPGQCGFILRSLLPEAAGGRRALETVSLLKCVKFFGIKGGLLIRAQSMVQKSNRVLVVSSGEATASSSAPVRSLRNDYFV